MSPASTLSADPASGVFTPRGEKDFAAAPASDIGPALHDLAARVFPICRSLTGDGIRETLHILRDYVPFEIHEVPTGTQVFDWTVPSEWNVRAAWIKDRHGRTIVDFKDNNLHVLQYSTPVSRRLPLDELRRHLFSLPEHPSWIPYRTSFFKANWGFCLAHEQLLALEDGEYEVFIDATLEPGSMTYGEFVVPGESSREILVFTHICHPSLANDNASGIAVLALLAQRLRGRKPRFTHRFVLAPGSIGAIAWLARNEHRVKSLAHGLVLACVGGPGAIHYKKSRRGDAEVDRVVEAVLRERGDAYQLRDFSPYGYAERQFCSPGFNLPVGLFMRTPHGEFPEYHTSADNLDFIRPEFLADSFEKLTTILETLDSNRVFVNRSPKCEPQLGARGLYGAIGGDLGAKEWEMALLWLLNQSDGTRSLLEIAARSKIKFPLLIRAAGALERAGLLEESANAHE